MLYCLCSQVKCPAFEVSTFCLKVLEKVTKKMPVNVILVEMGVPCFINRIRAIRQLLVRGLPNTSVAIILLAIMQIHLRNHCSAVVNIYAVHEQRSAKLLNYTQAHLNLQDL